MQVRLTPDASRPTRSVEAYALYLEALAISDLPAGKIDEFIDLVDRALALDPEFARAHLLKAMGYWQASGWTMDQELAQGLVYASASAALELDPDLIIARPFVVSANPTRYSWVDYVEALDEALAVEPNNLRLIDTMANLLFSTGYYAESLEYARKIVEIDPLSPLGYTRIGIGESALGNRASALEYWRQAVDLGSPEILNNMIFHNLIVGDHEAAILAMEERDAAFDRDISGVRSLIESVVDPATGKAALDEYLQRRFADAASRGEMGEAIDVYSWYVIFGYIDEAWDIVDKDRAENDTRWLNSDTLVFNGQVFPETGFTQDPRFVEDILVEIWELRGAPDRCSKIDGEWTCN